MKSITINFENRVMTFLYTAENGISFFAKVMFPGSCITSMENKPVAQVIDILSPFGFKLEQLKENTMLSWQEERENGKGMLWGNSLVQKAIHEFNTFLHNNNFAYLITIDNLKNGTSNISRRNGSIN